MRIGRGHRDFRDVTLLAYVRALLRRSHNNYQYGNPYISLDNEVRVQDALLKQATRNDSLHKSTKAWRNYCKMGQLHLSVLANTLRRQAEVGQPRLHGRHQGQHSQRHITYYLRLQDPQRVRSLGERHSDQIA